VQSDPKAPLQRIKIIAVASQDRDQSELVPNVLPFVLFPLAKKLRLPATLTASLPKINPADGAP
jgi:hypothetical protein